ncbi:MAG: FAD-dependent oxidoreductase, partial [Gammaproteobacteria bacterium]
MSGIVVIGAGQAAGQAAASLRQEGFEGEITIIGDEAQAPYQRPPLSKAYLSGEVGLDRVLVRPENFYADKGINLQTGVRVESINRADKTIATSTGSTLSSDKLLIATG